MLPDRESASAIPTLSAFLGLTNLKYGIHPTLHSQYKRRENWCSCNEVSFSLAQAVENMELLLSV